MKINKLLILGILGIGILLSGCGNNTQNTENKKTQDITTKAEWMQGQTDEAISEHCKMMPDMEGCNTINK